MIFSDTNPFLGRKFVHDFQILALMLTASIVSVQLRNIDNSLLLYLPTAIGIIAIHWFGPRVLVPIYLNALFTLFLWKASGGITRHLILATHESAIALTSWILARNLTRQQSGFNNIDSFIRFSFLGIAVPGIVNCFYTYHYSFVHGDLNMVATLWLADFITMYCIAIPVIHFFKPNQSSLFFTVSIIESESFSFLKKRAYEFLVLIFFFVVLNFIVDFKQYWFVYGICCCIIAVRRGFNLTVATNFVLFSLSYLIPLILLALNVEFLQPSSQLTYVHVGMATMFFVSALIGRAISDYKLKEKELTEQKKQLELANDQLKKTNSELDRFVYSVSHDISAPLKSIRGLITLFRMEGAQASVPFYIDKIQESVIKLEDFTTEVLEHSRSSRKEIKLEPVELHSFFNEILENLKYLQNFEKIKIIFELQESFATTDKFLLKVAASNILSNAIKYQRRYSEHIPEVKITSSVNADRLEIYFIDNGEGIPDEIKERVFDMFYRASTQSSGSGLGLYIAKESVEKLNGVLSLTTKYGEGSVFKISLPRN